MAALRPGRGRPITKERVAPPSYRDQLPEAIRHFDGHQIIPDPKNPHQSVLQGGSHHGSHPHLVHEFVRSIVEQRQPAVDAVTAANWTAAGICAHRSAMQGGMAVEIPLFGGRRCCKARRTPREERGAPGASRQAHGNLSGEPCRQGASGVTA
jgi:hypothetical protein